MLFSENTIAIFPENNEKSISKFEQELNNADIKYTVSRKETTGKEDYFGDGLQTVITDTYAFPDLTIQDAIQIGRLYERCFPYEV